MSKTQYLQRLAQSWYIRVKVRPMGDVAAALGALGRSDDHGIESPGRLPRAYAIAAIGQAKILQPASSGRIRLAARRQVSSGRPAAHHGETVRSGIGALGVAQCGRIAQAGEPCHHADLPTIARPKRPPARRVCQGVSGRGAIPSGIN